MVKFVSEHIFSTGSILDVCCGCGIIGVVCANKAKQVVGMDLNSEAIRIAKINAALNSVDTKSYFRIRDLTNLNRSEERFDVVCANPPYLAIPPDLSYPIEGNGGPDGTQVIRKILGGLPNWLNQSGEAFLILKSFVDIDPLLTPLLEADYEVKKTKLYTFGNLKQFIRTKVQDAYPSDHDRLEKIFSHHYAVLGVSHIDYYIIQIH